MNEHMTPETRSHDADPTPQELTALADSIDELARRFGIREDASNTPDSDGDTPTRFSIDITPDPTTSDIIRHILRTKDTIQGLSIVSSEPHENDDSATSELIESRQISVDVVEHGTDFEAERYYFFTRSGDRDWEVTSEDSEGQISDSLSKEELTKIKVLLAYSEQVVSKK